MDVNAIITALKQKKRNTRCNDLKQALESLGFEVRDGKRGGHKVFIHPNLHEFDSGSFNCDHGKNPQIKPIYVQNIIKVLEEFKDELSRLGEPKNE